MSFDFRSAWVGAAVAAILCSVAFVGFRASAQGTVIPPGYAAVVAVCGTLPAAYTAGTLALQGRIAELAAREETVKAREADIESTARHQLEVAAAQRQKEDDLNRERDDHMSSAQRRQLSFWGGTDHRISAGKLSEYSSTTNVRAT